MKDQLPASTPKKPEQATQKWRDSTRRGGWGNVRTDAPARKTSSGRAGAENVERTRRLVNKNAALG